MKTTGKRFWARLRASFVLPLLVLGVAATAIAQTPGTFTPTGDMTTARERHTATLLPNGKVLIAGGQPGGVPWRILASAELYDPSTGTFTATGDMTTARAGYTAVLRDSDKVLIAGGVTVFTSPPTSSAEIYKPAMQTNPPTFFRQVAVGGGFSTTFMLTNTDVIPDIGNLVLTDQQGSNLIVRSVSANATGSSFPFFILPGGATFLSVNTVNPNDPPKSGWASVDSSGGSLNGAATFQRAWALRCAR